MADIGDTVMVSFDDMVANNIRPGVGPKSADAAYVTNRYIVFVEFKDDSRIFEKPENLDEDERRKRAENLDSVQRKASESLCLFYRFLKDDPAAKGVVPRFVLVGVDPVQEIIAAIAGPGGVSRTETPSELVKFGIRDNDGSPVFYDSFESLATSDFAALIRRSRKAGRIACPPQNDRWRLGAFGDARFLPYRSLHIPAVLRRTLWPPDPPSTRYPTRPSPGAGAASTGGRSTGPSRTSSAASP